MATLPGVLPEEHPAHAAYARGTGTLELTQLIADRPELVEELKEVWLASYRRLPAHAGVFRLASQT